MTQKACIALFVLAGLGSGVYIIAGTTSSEYQQQLSSVAVADTTTADAPAPTTLLLPAEFAAHLTAPGRILIDVRTPEEYADGHIEGAENIDYYATEFETHLATLDPNTSYALYCRSGNRSGKTLAHMNSLGFTNVVDLAGGIVAWQDAGETLCTDC